jgi:hypothetical protein
VIAFMHRVLSTTGLSPRTLTGFDVDLVFLARTHPISSISLAHPMLPSCALKVLLVEIDLSPNQFERTEIYIYIHFFFESFFYSDITGCDGVDERDLCCVLNDKVLKFVGARDGKQFAFSQRNYAGLDSMHSCFSN